MVHRKRRWNRFKKLEVIREQLYIQMANIASQW